MKRGMKKLFVCITFVIILLMASGVFAESVGLSDDAKEIVRDFTEKKGISEESITNIEQVDFENLPDAVGIENIDDTNLAVYEVDYGAEKPVYVITVSDEVFRKKAENHEVLLLNFGFEGEIQSGFLKTATGVEGSMEKGYVMMREGSITGISTNLEVVDGSGEAEIIILKNGEEINFGNTFVADSSGIRKDYDIQSRGVVTFEQGDVISAYVKSDAVLKDVITITEITITKDL